MREHNNKMFHRCDDSALTVISVYKLTFKCTILLYKTFRIQLYNM